MLVGRFFLMIPVLAIAGSLGRKQPVPPSAGTFPTDTPLFAALLGGVVIIVVGLTYFPVDRARPDRRAPRRKVLRSSSELTDRRPTRRADRARSRASGRTFAPPRSASMFDPAMLRRASATRSASSTPAMARNPVMFVVEIGSVVTTLLFFRDALGARRPTTSSSGSWPRGCGSRCCSPTSPKRSPRGAARPRPTRCARPVPRRSLGCCTPMAPPARWRRATQGRRSLRGRRGRDHPR